MRVCGADLGNSNDISAFRLLVLLVRETPTEDDESFKIYLKGQPKKGKKSRKDWKYFTVNPGLLNQYKCAYLNVNKRPQRRKTLVKDWKDCATNPG